MPDSTRGLAPVLISRTVSSADVVGLDMGRIVSGVGRRPGRRADAHGSAPRGTRLPAWCCAWHGAAMLTAPTLTDGTVTLRAHRADDVQGSFEQCQDPVSQRWTTVPVPYTLEHA